MRGIFGGSIDAVARQWRAGSLSSDAAMERVCKLLPLGDREEYLAAKIDRNCAEVERGILVRRAADIVAGKGLS